MEYVSRKNNRHSNFFMNGYRMLVSVSIDNGQCESLHFASRMSFVVSHLEVCLAVQLLPYSYAAICRRLDRRAHGLVSFQYSLKIPRGTYRS